MKKSRTPKNEAPLLIAGADWTPTTTLTRSIHWKGLTLGLTLNYSAGEWVCLALQGPSQRTGQTADEHAEALLASHAHEIVGRSGSLFEALELANKYGAQWLANGESLQTCPCSEIGS